MTSDFEERLNQILPKITSDDFLSGRGLGNEIAFFIFDYPPEQELRIRKHIEDLKNEPPPVRAKPKADKGPSFFQRLQKAAAEAEKIKTPKHKKRK